MVVMHEKWLNKCPYYWGLWPHDLLWVGRILPSSVLNVCFFFFFFLIITDKDKGSVFCPSVSPGFWFRAGNGCLVSVNTSTAKRELSCKVLDYDWRCVSHRASHSCWGDTLKEMVCVDSSGQMNILAERLLKGAQTDTSISFLWAFLKYLFRKSKCFVSFFLSVEQVMKKELNLTSSKSISDSSFLSLRR